MATSLHNTAKGTLDLCSEGTWMVTRPHDTAKGVACETRSEPPPSPASLAVELTQRTTRTPERQKHYLAMLAFLLYE